MKKLCKIIGLFATVLALPLLLVGCMTPSNAFEELGEQETPLCEHQWLVGGVVESPTYQEEGLMFYYCPNCGETKYEVMPIKPLPPDASFMEDTSGISEGRE